MSLGRSPVRCPTLQDYARRERKQTMQHDPLHIVFLKNLDTQNSACYLFGNLESDTIGNVSCVILE